MNPIGSTYRGPATLASPYMPPINPMYIGRCRRGTVLAMIKIAPLKIPAAPRPATARPMMRVIEFGATPDIKEPSSNTNKAAR